MASEPKQTHCNICTVDRVTRIALGVIFIIFSIVATPWINLFQLAGPAWYIQSILALLVGILFLRAGLTRRCPINKALGLNTNKKRKR